MDPIYHKLLHRQSESAFRANQRECRSLTSRAGIEPSRRLKFYYHGEGSCYQGPFHDCETSNFARVPFPAQLTTNAQFLRSMGAHRQQTRKRERNIL